MLLQQFVERYCDVRPISEDYALTLKKRAKRLSQFSGRSDLAGVFNEATVNAFLGTLKDLSPYTINKYRGDILVIWRAAADEDRIPYPQPRRIKRIRIVPQVIECYLEHEARLLACTAAQLRGAYPNGVARRHYWSAAIRCAWDSGLRRGDLWKLRREHIRKDRTAVIIQNKTGRMIVCRFHPSTIKALEQAGGHLEWTICRRCFGIHFRELLGLTGIGRGTFRWLRRGSGSRIDADHPGLGHEHLGNGRQIFDKHYNARLRESDKPMPPEL